MSAAKHTPGPWIAARHGLSVHTINTADGAAGPAVCALMTPSGAIENHEANARLIAAAPELLKRTERSRSTCLQVADLLRHHLAGCEVNGMDATAQTLRDSIALLCSTADANDAAIAKATGSAA